MDFRSAILPHRDRLFRLALSITADVTEAEDVVQDAMLKAWERRDEWPQIGNMQAWLTQITKNIALDSARRKQRVANTISLSAHAPQPSTLNPPLGPKGRFPQKEPSTIIPAHGHLILWADKLEATTQLHTDFKLGNSDGQMVLVTSSDDFVANNATFFEAHPQLTDFADALIYTAHSSIHGANTICLMNRPSIGRPNTLTSYDQVIGHDEGIMLPDHITDLAFTDPDVSFTNPDGSITDPHGSPEGLHRSGYYTLSGLRLPTSNLRPGLYIVRYADGKSRKVLISDGSR